MITIGNTKDNNNNDIQGVYMLEYGSSFQTQWPEVENVSTLQIH